MTHEIEKGHVGSSFDDFLREEGTYEETTKRAIKRVQIRQIQAAMEAEKPGKNRDGGS